MAATPNDRSPNPFAKAAYSSWWVSKRASAAITAAERAVASHVAAESLVADAKALLGPVASATVTQSRRQLRVAAIESSRAKRSAAASYACWRRARAASTPHDPTDDPRFVNLTVSAEHLPAAVAMEDAQEAAHNVTLAAAGIADMILALIDPRDPLAGPLRDRALAMSVVGDPPARLHSRERGAIR